MNDLTGNGDAPFGDDAIMHIAEIAGVANDHDSVARLKDVLVPLGREFHRVISLTPSELDRSPSKDSLSQRLEWLDTQVLNPLMKLTTALHPDNRFRLSLWPQEVSPDLMPDLDDVASHLDHLKLLVD